MSQGSALDPLFAYYPGSPVSVAVATFDQQKATLVIDTTNALAYIKQSALGSNSSYFQLAFTSGSTLTGSTLAGTTTLSGVEVVTSQSLSGAGAVDITHDTTKFTSTGSAQALTLADGVDGQKKTIMHVVDGGSGVLTPTTKTGFSTITFTNAGDSVQLQFNTTQGWIAIGVSGATLA